MAAFDGFRAIHRAYQERPRAAASAKLWPASERRARLCAKRPAINSAMTRAKVRVMPVPIFRIDAVGGAWEWLWPQCDGMDNCIVHCIGNRGREGVVMSNLVMDTPTGVNSMVCEWVEECVELCEPDLVVWCDGSAGQRQELLDLGVRQGIFIKLNPQKRPGCYLHRSNPNDVARS